MYLKLYIRLYTGKYNYITWPRMVKIPYTGGIKLASSSNGLLDNPSKIEHEFKT